MPDDASTRLRLRKQADAANNNAWGVYLNDDVIELVDEAIAGVAIVPVAAAVTLTSVSFYTDQARKATLIFTGVGGFDVTIPAVEKIYVVHNKCAAAVGIKTGGGAVASVGPTRRVLVYCDGTDVVLVAQNSSADIGDIKMRAGTTVPDGWLLCYGQAVSRTTYAALYAEIGTTWGAGNGSTTFNVPDLRGRVPAGQDDMGGTSANRLTGLSGGVNGDTLGAAGGAESHVLTLGELAAHSHGVSDPGHTHSHSDPGHTHTSRDHNHIWYNSGGSSWSLDGTNVAGGWVSYGSTGAPKNITDPLVSDYYTGAMRDLGGAISDVNSALTGMTNVSNTTGITTTNSGSGAAHNNVQPTAIVNMIIFAGV